MTGMKRKAKSVALLALPAAWLVPTAMVQAQVSGEIVQPLPAAGSEELNIALRRLATNARDVGALLDAGEAALKLGDIEAAIGFFGRAEALSPNNPRVFMGKGAAFTRSRRPIEALRLFAEAQRLGVPDSQMAAERGLAFDLVGDSASAQQLYRAGLARGADSELTRRLAISQAIAGDDKGFEATLLPSLQAGDLSAFRTRAFGLAILGKVDDAIEIAEARMPAEMVGRITPYLRYMPRLTNAQQAAAANLGYFPRAGSIGTDEPGIANYAKSRAEATPLAQANAAASAGELPPVTGAPGGAALAPVPATRTQPAVAAPKAAEPPRRAARNDDRPSGTIRQQEIRAELARRQPERVAVSRQPQPTTTTGQIASPSAASAAAAPQQSVVGVIDRPVVGPAVQPIPGVVGVIDRPVTGPAATARQGVPGVIDRPAGAAVATATTASPPAASPPDTAPRQQQVLTLTPSPTPAPTSGQQPAGSVATPSAAPTATAPSTATPPVAIVTPPVAQAASTPVPPASQPAPQVQPTPPSVADAFSGFDLTTTPSATNAPGAVDITRIVIPREFEKEPPKPVAKAEPKPKPKPEPPKAQHPSRHWVQVATGRDRNALKFDWRRISRSAEGKLDKKGPFVTRWVEANRLLAGPYDSADEARKIIKELKDLKVDSFLFTSAAGEAIEPLK